ncbi:MAG: putative bifunctional diguanylate cyclase/phosphodiesterase [Janthinobacterium lividum]
MRAHLTATRPGGGRLAGGAGSLTLAGAMVCLAVRRGEDSDLITVCLGVAGVVACVLALVMLETRRNSDRYRTAGLIWGLATACAGLFPHAALTSLPLTPLLFATSTAGSLVLVLHLLRRARSRTDEPPLIADALMLGSALATVGWDGLARTGHSGGSGWVIATVVVLVTTSLLACASIALAIEHPRLRIAAVGGAVNGTGTVLGAVTLNDHPLIAHLALGAGLIGGVLSLLNMPRGEMLQNGGDAAARAAHRLELASLAPGLILLIDIVVLVVAPRADPVLFGFFVSVLVAFSIRHVATARSIDATTARLTFQALHDALTGLPNRVALEAALHQPDREQSLMLLEMEGLDDVNDVLGVAAGDSVISAAAGEVRLLADRLGARTFRTGGDEFAVLIPGGPARALRHAATFIAVISTAPAAVEGVGRFPLTAVAGIAACRSQDGVTPDDGPHDVMVTLVQAGIALRDAKHLGDGSVSVFSGAVAADHARRSLLRERLAEAIRDGDIDVHYQPVVSFTTGRVDKFEALARWEDAVLGRISPVEFIAVAEESNLVVALGEHVLRSAVQWAFEAGVFSAGVGLAVNVSVVQLQAPGFSDIVRDVLEQFEIAPHLLTLELTESVFLDEDSPAERVVNELVSLGCQIAIDDFGTGYSAFGYLGRLPVHVLKIDRSLTQSLTDDVNGQSVVTCVVDLATRLGLAVIVEGVETDEQAEICRFISAPLGQGWLYSAAVPRHLLGEQLARTYPVPKQLHPVREDAAGRARV